MLIYLPMFIIAECFALFTARKYQGNELILMKRKKLMLSQQHFFYWMTSLPFLLVAVLRYKVGTDYTVYSRLQIPEVMKGINDRVEFLYRYVIKLGMAMGDKHWVFVLTHIIIIYFFWQAMKESDNLPMSLFVFMFGCYYNLSLNTMRQFIAMGIALYATKYIYQRKFWYYAAWIVIATLFHSTGAVYIIFYFLAKYKLPKALPLVASAGCFVLSNVARGILMRLSSVFTTYEDYLGSEYDKMDTQWDYLLFNMLLLAVIFVYEIAYAEQDRVNLRNSPKTILRELLCKVQRNKTGYVTQEELKYQTFVWLQFFTTIFACVSNVIPNSTRIIVLTGVAQMIMVPMILRKLRVNKDLQAVVTVCIMLLYLMIFYRKILFGNYGETLPYEFIWNR